MEVAVERPKRDRPESRESPRRGFRGARRTLVQPGRVRPEGGRRIRDQPRLARGVVEVDSGWRGRGVQRAQRRAERLARVRRSSARRRPRIDAHVTVPALMSTASTAGTKKAPAAIRVAARAAPATAAARFGRTALM